MRNRCLLVSAVCLLILVLAEPAAAQDTGVDRSVFDAVADRVGAVHATRFDPAACAVRPSPARSKDWRFFVAPYGWLASVEGTIVSGGEATDVEVSFSDLAEVISGGFQLYTEIRWRKLFIAFDGTWATLGTEVEGTLLNIDVDIDQRIFDCRVGYEVYRKSRDGCLDPCCEKWRRWVVADVFVGARYWYTKQEVTLQGQGPIGIEATLEGLDERWDPFLGARFGFDITRRFGIGVRGDIGGFGVGDAAQLSWQVSGGVSYDLMAFMHLFVGWRAIAFDTVTGTGTNRNGADFIQHGPLFGLGFSF